MLTFICNICRFQSFSFLLTAVCVAGIAWICQSTAVDQPEGEYEYSYNAGDEQFS